VSLFPDTIARALGGGKVLCAALARFDFTSETMRLWRGYGTLTTNDGAQWSGLGEFGEMSGIEQAVNGEAPEATFTLSGLDADVMRLARDEFESEVRGRMARVYLQFFGVEDAEDPDNQRPLDNPYPVWAGRLLKPTFSLAPADGDSPGTRSVSISAESLFSLRSRPKASLYTDADQQRRFPGDKGFEFVASLVNKVLTWPDY
jgi:hypothetical protein